ncbi:hypothetical protein [Mycolicibacterium sediminis]|nr:hypothetical protein [Mycolicibacterium sediminis]
MKECVICRSFNDLDGHSWQIFWINPDADAEQEADARGGGGGI